MKNAVISTFIMLLMVVALLVGMGSLRYAMVVDNMEEGALLILYNETTDIPLVLDYYGNVCIYEYRVEKTMREARVHSYGRDGKLGGGDDWFVSKIDYNKSLLLGKYTAEKGKEFAKGVIDSVLDRSKFEEKNVDD